MFVGVWWWWVLQWWVFVSFIGKDRVGLRWVSGGDCIGFAVEIAVGGSKLVVDLMVCGF